MAMSAPTHLCAGGNDFLAGICVYAIGWLSKDEVERVMDNAEEYLPAEEKVRRIAEANSALEKCVLKLQSYLQDDAVRIVSCCNSS